MPEPSPPRRRKARIERSRRLGVRRQPLRDLYHHLISASWGQLFLFFFVFYLTTNAAFAVAYRLDADGIENAHGLLDSFFFSVQTMATIGYGRMTPRSVFANALVTFEALFGLVSTAMATGLMFAKFSRPTARVVFARCAVVAQRGGRRSLMLRLANERAVGLVEASMRVSLVRREHTGEGERIFRVYTLPLTRAQTGVFALSWIVVHPIDEGSPLFGETPESLVASETEIIAALVGMEGSTGGTVHARHTYFADEILFGKRYVDIIYPDGHGEEIIDLRHIHDVEDAEP